MKIHSFPIILIILLTVSYVYSQKASISGQVVCSKSGLAIEYATMAITDSTGQMVNVEKRRIMQVKSF